MLSFVYMKKFFYTLLFLGCFTTLDIAYADVTSYIWDGDNTSIFFSGSLGGVHAYSYPSGINLGNGDNEWGPLDPVTAFTTSNYFGVTLYPDEHGIQIFDVPTGGTCIGLTASECSALSGGSAIYYYSNSLWSETDPEQNTTVSTVPAFVSSTISMIINSFVSLFVLLLVYVITYLWPYLLGISIILLAYRYGRGLLRI